MIIAIVPAPSHSSLVAEGPMGERPALLCRFGPTSKWGPFDADFAIAASAAGANFGEPEWQWALVLHAPGSPRLGMLRAMEAVYIIDLPSFADLRMAARPEYEIPNRPDGLNDLGASAFALAHLLVQRGIAAEVIVIEPADKAKE